METEGPEEGKQIQDIGTVVTLLNGEKPWVVVSHFLPPESNVLLIGLCDGEDFKYEEERNFCGIAHVVTDSHNALIERSLYLCRKRQDAYSLFTRLQENGGVPSDLTTDDWQVRRSIDRVFRRCLNKAEKLAGNPDALDNTLYIRDLRNALRRVFYQRGIDPHDRPLLNNTEIHFQSPEEIVRVQAEGREIDLVTMHYIEKMLTETMDVPPAKPLSSHAIRYWLTQCGIHAVPFKATITYEQTVVCDAFDLQELRVALEEDPFHPEVASESLDQLDDDGSISYTHHETGEEEVYWHPASFAKHHKITERRNSHLVKILNAAFPDSPHRTARMPAPHKTECSVWPDEALLQIRTLFLNTEGEMEMHLSDGDSNTVTVSTISSMIPTGTEGAGLLSHALRENTSPITLQDIRNWAGDSSCTITSVKRMRADKRHIAVQRVEIGDSIQFLLFVEVGASDDQSIVLVGDAYSVENLEPARKLEDLIRACETQEELQ